MFLQRSAELRELCLVVLRSLDGFRRDNDAIVGLHLLRQPCFQLLAVGFDDLRQYRQVGDDLEFHVNLLYFRQCIRRFCAGLPLLVKLNFTFFQNLQILFHIAPFNAKFPQCRPDLLALLVADMRE